MGKDSKEPAKAGSGRRRKDDDDDDEAMSTEGGRPTQAATARRGTRSSRPASRESDSRDAYERRSQRDRSRSGSPRRPDPRRRSPRREMYQEGFVAGRDAGYAEASRETRDELRDTRTDRDRYRSERANLRSQVENLRSEVSELRAERDESRVELEVRSGEIHDLREQVAFLQARMPDSEDEDDGARMPSPISSNEGGATYATVAGNAAALPTPLVIARGGPPTRRGRGKGAGSRGRGGGRGGARITGGVASTQAAIPGTYPLIPTTANILANTAAMNIAELDTLVQTYVIVHAESTSRTGTLPEGLIRLPLNQGENVVRAGGNPAFRDRGWYAPPTSVQDILNIPVGSLQWRALTEGIGAIEWQYLSTAQRIWRTLVVRYNGGQIPPNTPLLLARAMRETARFQRDASTRQNVVPSTDDVNTGARWTSLEASLRLDDDLGGLQGLPPCVVADDQGNWSNLAIRGWRFVRRLTRSMGEADRREFITSLIERYRSSPGWTQEGLHWFAINRANLDEMEAGLPWDPLAAEDGPTTGPAWTTSSRGRLLTHLGASGLSEEIDGWLRWLAANWVQPADWAIPAASAGSWVANARGTGWSMSQLYSPSSWVSPGAAAAAPSSSVVTTTETSSSGGVEPTPQPTDDVAMTEATTDASNASGSNGDPQGGSKGGECKEWK